MNTASSDFGNDTLGDFARQCSEQLGGLRDLAERAEAALDIGVTLGEIKGITEANFETLLDAVQSLCLDERFSDALPIALQLVGHEPRDWRFFFAAAKCFQRMGEAELAIPLYGLSLMARPTPGAALRLGECHARLGNAEQAHECFAAVPNLCIGAAADDQMVEWADRAARALSAN